MEEKELFESFWLCTIKGIGARSVDKLLGEAGSAAQVKNLPMQKVIACIGQKRAEALEAAASKKERQHAQNRLMRIWEKRISFLPRWHPAYPERLKTIPDPPLMLFAKGKLPEEEQKQAALIGARACSAYGAQMARYFSEQLACAGVGIISGMARGIDSIAQETALYAGQRSVAVLGCGVDICYPPENRLLYDRLEREGCLLSEYLPGTQPQSHLFPPRNRIISGLSDLVLVIEAREKSGTLITVDMALEQGREVFAVPGRVPDVCSRGCNWLIANGAGIAANASVVLDALERVRPVDRTFSQRADTGLNGNDRAERICENARPLTPQVLAALDTDFVSLDALADRFGGQIQMPELMQELLLLNMEGIVISQGGMYCKK